MRTHAFTCLVGNFEARVTWLGEEPDKGAFAVHIESQSGRAFIERFTYAQEFTSAQDVLDLLEVLTASNELLNALSRKEPSEVLGEKAGPRPPPKLRLVKPS